MTADERKRVKKFGPDNLNITNMMLDGSLTSNDGDKMIISPRKTVVFNEKPKYSITFNEKVLMKQSEGQNKESLNSLEETTLFMRADEINFLNSKRTTTYQHVDMQQTSTNEAKSATSPTNKTSSKSKAKPVASKEPLIPKIFKIPSVKISEPAMKIDSPPKTFTNFQTLNENVDEPMDLEIKITPEKSLCRKLLASRKHNITPMQDQGQPPSKIVYSASKNWLNRPFQLAQDPVQTLNHSSDILKSLGFSFDSPASVKKKTSSNGMMELEVSKENISQVFLIDPNDNRKTVFEGNISVEEEEAAGISNKIETRKTVFERSIDVESLAEPSSSTSTKMKTLYDVFIDETSHTVPAKVVQTAFVSTIPEHTPSHSRASNKVERNRVTVYEDSISMDEVEQAELNKSLFKGNDINETSDQFQALMATRKTVYNKSIEKEEAADKSSSSQAMATRRTVFEASMDETNSAIPAFIRSNDVVESISVKGPKSGPRLTPFKNRNSRKTVFEASMDETNSTIPAFIRSNDVVENISVKGPKSGPRLTPFKNRNSRKTVFEASMDETNSSSSFHSVKRCCGNISVKGPKSGPRLTPFKNRNSRKTVFESSIDETNIGHIPVPELSINNRMDFEEDDAAAESLAPNVKKARKTVYEGSMIEDEFAVPQTPASHVKATRKTIFDASLDETNNAIKSFIRPAVFTDSKSKDTASHSRANNFESNRATIYEDNISIDETETKTSRKALFSRANAKKPEKSSTSLTSSQPEKTFFDLSIEMTEAKMPTVEELQDVSGVLRFACNPVLRETLFTNNISITSRHDQFRKSSLMLGDGININDSEMLETTNELAAKAAHLLKNPMATTASTSNLFTKTFQNDSSIDLEVSNVTAPNTNEDFAGPSRRNQTFTLKNDNTKLMNITDADFVSMIDDESNPCVNESLTATHELQTSFNGNISYHQALQDFVNITINDLPVNMTIDSTPENFRNRKFDQPADISVMLDDFVAKLERKNTVKPRLEFDEYLENLNIKPVKIKRLPNMQDIHKMFVQNRERVKQRTAKAQAGVEKRHENPELSFKKKLER